MTDKAIEDMTIEEIEDLAAREKAESETALANQLAEANAGLSEEPPTDDGDTADEPATPDTQADAPTKEPGEDWQAKAAQAAKEREEWEQKFKTLQGKYNAEAPSRANLQSLKEEFEDLRQQLAKPHQGQPIKPAAQPTQPDLSLDEKAARLAEKYEASPDLMKELLEEMGTLAEAKAQKLAEPLAQSVQQMTQAQRARAAQEFEDKLNEDVPDWDKINHDPEFHQYLKRQRVNLQTLADDLDTEGVINHFTTFEQLRQTAAPTEDLAKTKDTGDAQRAAIAAQAGARTSSSAPVSKGNGKRHYSEAMWKGEYDRASTMPLGAEKDKLIAELDDALITNRVLGLSG